MLLGQVVKIPTAVLETQEGVTSIEKLLHSSTEMIFPVVDSHGQLISKLTSPHFICQKQRELSLGNLDSSTYNNNIICDSEGIWDIVKKEAFLETNSQSQLSRQTETKKTSKKWPQS